MNLVLFTRFIVFIQNEDNKIMVPKSKQGETPKTNFFHKTYVTISNIIKFAMTDFGIIDKRKDITFYLDKFDIMDPIDKELLMTICTKYDIKIAPNTPEWMVNNYQNHIMNLGLELIDLLSKANSIFIKDDMTIKMREKYQNDAIGCAYSILHTLTILEYALKADMNRISPYIAQIEDMITYIKKWKKSDGKAIKSAIKRNIAENLNLSDNIMNNIIYYANNHMYYPLSMVSNNLCNNNGLLPAVIFGNYYTAKEYSDLIPALTFIDNKYFELFGPGNKYLPAVYFV